MAETSQTVVSKGWKIITKDPKKDPKKNPQKYCLCGFGEDVARPD
jgi:hypothetical protein